MTDAALTAPQPTYADLAVAFADALAPFAGPAGIAADTVMHAVLVFATNLQERRAAGLVNFSMADLEAAAAKATDRLAQLKADVDAQAAAGEAKA